MNLHALRLFHEVAKCGGVTKASEVLRISQPSVTAQIKKFEKEQGVRLIEPAGRGIQLTPLGQQVYQLSQALFAVEEQIEGVFEEQQGRQKVLRLGGNYLTVQHLLPEWLAEFAVFPEYQVQLATLNASDLLKALADGELDVAVLGAEGDTASGLVRQQVYSDRLCFVAQPSLAEPLGEASLQALSRVDFIGRERRSFTQQALEALFRSENVDVPRFYLTYNNSREALQETIAGKGVHFCSYLMVRDLIVQGELAEVNVTIPPQPHELYLYHRQEIGAATRVFKGLASKMSLDLV